MVAKARKWEQLTPRSESAANLFEASIPRGNRDKLSLFGLPREIRDRIYHYLCGNKKVVTGTWYSREVVAEKLIISTRYYDDYPHSGPYKVTPFLRQLQVSSQFYQEAISIFFSASQFGFQLYDTFFPFFYGLPPIFRSKIRNLHINLWSDTGIEKQYWCNPLFRRSMAQFSDLRVLRINIHDESEEILELLPKIRFISSRSFPLLKALTIRYQNLDVSANRNRIPLEHEECIAQLIAAEMY